MDEHVGVGKANQLGKRGSAWYRFTSFISCQTVGGTFICSWISERMGEG